MVFTLRENHKWQVPENKMPKKISGLKNIEGTCYDSNM
jgi:hypothetical protein